MTVASQYIWPTSSAIPIFLPPPPPQPLSHCVQCVGVGNNNSTTLVVIFCHFCGNDVAELHILAREGGGEGLYQGIILLATRFYYFTETS